MNANSISVKSFFILIGLIICTYANSQVTDRVKSLEIFDVLEGHQDTRGTTLCINNMNEFVIAGTYSSGLPGPYDGTSILTRWSDTGDLLQQKFSNVPGFPSTINCIVPYAGNKYAAVGNYYSQGGLIRNAYFSLFDLNFNNQMSIGIFNTNFNSYATGVIEVSPGIFIISGFFTINGLLRPGLIKVGLTGNIITAVSLNITGTYYDRFRLKDEGNGTLTAQGLRNAVMVFDTSLNIISQSNFICAAVTSCLRPSSNGGYISVSSDDAVGGTAITVATMDANFNQVQNSIKFHHPGYKLQPLDVFQDPSGTISVYMSALNVTNQSSSLVLFLLDSTCQILSRQNYTDASVAQANAGFICNDVIHSSNGRFYAAGASPSNVYVPSASRNLTLAILNAGSGCWSGTFPNPTISAAATILTNPVQLVAMSTINNALSISNGATSGLEYTKCLTTSVDEISESTLSVSVYPTVASEQLNIVFEGPSVEWTARFFDLTGREVLEMNLTESGLYDVQALKSGMYMVVFSAGDIVKTKYVIKQ